MKTVQEKHICLAFEKCVFDDLISLDFIAFGCPYS